MRVIGLGLGLGLGCSGSSVRAGSTAARSRPSLAPTGRTIVGPRSRWGPCGGGVLRRFGFGLAFGFGFGLGGSD